MSRGPRSCGALLLALLIGACGGSASSGAITGVLVGAERDKPGGGTYFVDPHELGHAEALRLIDMSWGRLVDVHSIDADGETIIEPAFRDFVVDQNILNDGTNYEITTNPLTQRTRMVILRQRGGDDPEGQRFEDLLRSASNGLPPVLAKNDDGSSAPPFSLIARNATLMLHFNDLLETEDNAERLSDLIRVTTGYRPETPFDSRMLFDENHGGESGGRFHPTRILIDFAVSPVEANTHPSSIPPNPVGLPPSDRFSDNPNVALRLPSRVDFGSGQFHILTNLSGRALVPEINGPNDPFLVTRPVVRAMRSGNNQDVNRGFLFDLKAPELLGTFLLNVVRAEPDLDGRDGLDFILDTVFTTPCRVAPRRGDSLDLRQFQVEITEAPSQPDSQGLTRNLRVSIAGAQPVHSTQLLLGSGGLITAYFVGGGLDPACWLRLDPPAGVPPSGDVGANTRIVARFSEPMNESTLGAFDTFRIVRGTPDPGQALRPQDFVVGNLIRSPGRDEISFTPLLPLANSPGIDYQIQIIGGAEGVADLSGNGLALAPPGIGFRVDPDTVIIENGGLAMRFAGIDELAPEGAPDFRGQIFLDVEEGIIRPRPLTFGTAAADRASPLPSIMLPFPPGVQTPLSPLGSKMMTSWRYADFGWLIDDESRYDVDVVGMSWSPVGGLVLGDFFPRFEIRLGHGARVLDEAGTNQTGPLFPGTSLRQAPAAYTENLLEGTDQTVVHERSLGYLLSPGDVTVNVNGTPLMPFPWNRGPGPKTTFTWRDTSIEALAGFGGVGVPLRRETTPPINVDTMPGSFAPQGRVPTVGLPLLWEIRCYPTTAGIGLNPFDISLVFGMFNQLKNRVFSTGGTDLNGMLLEKDPDLEISPSGGLNPASNPPGIPTPAADPVFYVGQIDIVVRVSRAHTIWVDTGLFAPEYLQPVVEPTIADQPPGTSVLLEFRGASTFNVTNPLDPFDASSMDAYGNLGLEQVVFPSGESQWSADVTKANGARFIQMRMSFFNNMNTGQSPVLSSIGLAFRD